MSRRIVIAAMGTAGDVVPSVELARGLIAAAQDVVVTTEAAHEAFVRGAGIPWRSLCDVSAERHRRIVELALAQPSIGKRTELFLGLLVESRFAEVAGELEALLRDDDVLMLNGLLQHLLLLERFRGPRTAVWYSGPFVDGWLQFPDVNPEGEKFFAFPASLFPGTKLPDMPFTKLTTTGFWRRGGRAGAAALPARRRPTAYFTLGSARGSNVAPVLEAAAAAARTAGFDLWTEHEWPDDRGRPPEGLVTGLAAPHDAVMPAVDCVVHQGGIGTTAAALKALRPSIVLPQWGDQSEWGRLLVARGLAFASIEPADVDGRSLAAAFATATGGPRHEAFEASAKAATAEDGIGVASSRLLALAAD